MPILIIDLFVASGAFSHHLQPPQSGCGLLKVHNECRLSSETIKVPLNSHFSQFV